MAIRPVTDQTAMASALRRIEASRLNEADKVKVDRIDSIAEVFFEEIYPRLDRASKNALAQTCRTFHHLTDITHSPACIGYSKIGSMFEPFIRQWVKAIEELVVEEANDPDGLNEKVPGLEEQVGRTRELGRVLFREHMRQLDILPDQEYFASARSFVQRTIQLYGNADKSKIIEKMSPFLDRVLTDMAQAYCHQDLEKITIRSFKQHLTLLRQCFWHYDPIDIEIGFRNILSYEHGKELLNLAAAYRKMATQNADFTAEGEKMALFLEELFIVVNPEYEEHVAERTQALHAIIDEV